MQAAVTESVDEVLGRVSAVLAALVRADLTLEIAALTGMLTVTYRPASTPDGPAASSPTSS
jgi:hypothetical protein